MANQNTNQSVASQQAARQTVSLGCQGPASALASAIQIVLVLIVDATESMLPFVDGARLAINGLLDILAQAGFRVEFGLVVFRDETCGECPICYDIGLSPEDIKSVLAQTKPDGGGDPPESALLAIRHAVRLRGYPQGARPIFCLVSDADTHDPEQGVSSDDIRTMLVENKVTLFACTPDLPVYRKLVDATGGTLFPIAKDMDATTFKELIHEFGHKTVHTVHTQLTREMQEAMQAELRKTRAV